MVLTTDGDGGEASSKRPKFHIESEGESNDVDEDDDDDEDVYQEFEEYEDFSELPDNKSIASDDSFYPVDDCDPYLRSPSPETLSFYQACSNNNSIIVKMMIRQGVTEEEVRETDKNKRTGLIIACYHGYVDVVIALSQCPHLDVNWQDNEGNTALIMAAQAGHVAISNYLLNYYPGLDMERRNCHGFTATMKAAMQGRAECVRTLMLAGGDLDARDHGRKLTPQEWALFTGRYETVHLMERLLAQPCAAQFCDTYRVGWHPGGVANAQERGGGRVQALRERLCCCFTARARTAPQPDGVLDHMVRLTTGLTSPWVALACRTVCPGSPPCVGKRRPAVQEILRRQRLAELRSLGPERLHNYQRLFQNSRVLLVPRAVERRSSLQPNTLRDVAAASVCALRRSSLLPLHMMRRSSVRPGLVVPKVRVSKAPKPTYEPERLRPRGGATDTNLLQTPKWRYKELKEQRRLDPVSRHLQAGRKK